MDQRRNGRQGGGSFENWLTRTRRAASELYNQGNAFSRGAEDAFTFGVADRWRAGTGALGDALMGKNLGGSFRQRMAFEHAADRHDAKHYGMARTTGKVAGAVGQIALMGPLEGAAVGGVRVVQATKLLPREYVSLGGAGALGGLASQAADDLSRRELSSAGDYLGSAVGGSAGALTAVTGFGSYSGAAAGATTSIAQDILNKRHPSLDRARESALEGGALGTLAGVGGRIGFNRLTNKEKEQWGEAASWLRTLGRWDRTATTKKTREYLPNSRRYTVPDQRTVSGELVESKGGNKNNLRRNQKAYFDWKDKPNRYRVDSLTSRDVGAAWAFPAAQEGFRGWPDEPSTD